MPDITLQLAVFRILALVVISVVHGASIALAAVLLGDKGPKYDKRLTLGPGAHLDLLGGLGFVLFGFGWGKPVDVDPGELRFGRWAAVAVVLAGFLGLLALAFLFMALVVPALTTLPHSAALNVAAFLRSAASHSVWFALFSLAPIPPLAGGLILTAAKVRVSAKAYWILGVLLLVVAATGEVRRLLAPWHAALMSVLPGG